MVQARENARPIGSVQQAPGQPDVIEQACFRVKGEVSLGRYGCSLPILVSMADDSPAMAMTVLFGCDPAAAIRGENE